MQHTLYHSLLRIASLSVALVLVFDSGLLSPATEEVSHNTQQYLANAIGVKASVESSDLNELTAKLTAQKQALDAREADLASREISVGLNQAASQMPLSTLILSFILFILLVLIVLNYVLDYLRQTQTRPVGQPS